MPHEIAHGSLRLTLSHETTKDDLDYTVEELKKAIRKGVLKAVNNITKNAFVKISTKEELYDIYINLLRIKEENLD